MTTTGGPDVLSASFNDDTIAWYRNKGGGAFESQRVISTDADGARFVHAADLDGDGDVDVLSASWLDDKIAWYENRGGGTFSAQRVITQDADGGRAVHAADLDLDGDLDVLSASAHDDKIAWYENFGDGTFSHQRIIDDQIDYATSVFAADMDGDGDPDVVAAAERGDEIVWYRNDGRAMFSKARVVTEAVDGPLYVHVADADGDGDMDVVGASIEDHRVAWHENLGGGVFGKQRVISTSQARPWAVHMADLDGDGDADVVAASKDDDTIAWYENLGFLPTAPSLAPGNVRAVTDFDSITVTWDGIPAIGDGGSAILRYVVFAVPEIGSGTATCTASITSGGCVLVDLTPGLGYSITVHAENEVAAGPRSNALNVHSVCEAPATAPAAAGRDSTIRVTSLPVSADGEPRQPAQSTFRWSSASAQPYAVTVQDESAFACPSSGSVQANEEVETALVAVCREVGERDVGVTITTADAVATTTWRVRCSYGNAVVLAVEHYQGPMARRWRAAVDEADVYAPLLAGRSAVLVARIGHDSAAAPDVLVGVTNAAGGELASDVSEVLEPHTSSPKVSQSGLWETERTFEVEGDVYAPENRVRVEVDPANALQETDESDNVADAAIEVEQLPQFRIVFVPIRSVVGEPAALDAATYMKHIYDFFPIADDYVAKVGETFAFDARSWDQHDATIELMHLWNTEADGDEYWQGIYKYPYDGSACGYTFLGAHVSIAASVDDGCTPNINAHEVGHSLNLRHPRRGCGGANVDPDFPYDGAAIGPRRGWFFSAGRFVSAEDEFADTMSYCGPDYFISDYHFRKAFDHLRAADDSKTSGAFTTARFWDPYKTAENGPADAEREAGRESDPTPSSPEDAELGRDGGGRRLGHLVAPLGVAQRQTAVGLRRAE